MLLDRRLIFVGNRLGLVTHTTTFRELALRELRFVRVPAPRGLSFAAGVASLRPAYGCLETNPTSFGGSIWIGVPKGDVCRPRSFVAVYLAYATTRVL